MADMKGHAMTDPTVETFAPLSALPGAAARRRREVRIFQSLRNHCGLPLWPEIYRAKLLIWLVGVAGFEPATPSSRTAAAPKNPNEISRAQ